MSSRVIPIETTSVIFQYDSEDFLWAYLPNGKRVNPNHFGKLIFASTNFPSNVSDRLADDILSGNVLFPFYLNITRSPK